DGRSSPDATPRSPRASPTPSGCRGRAARPRTPASSPPGTGLSGSCGGGARYACTASKSSPQVLAAGPSSYSSDLPMPHAADLCTNAWQMAKHGGRDRRTWRKLHLAIDPDTSEVLASALTTTEEGDASLVRPLLDQIAAPIAAVLADGAYDGDPVYRAAADRAPAAPEIIPPRATAVVSEVSVAGTPTPRDRHIEMIAAKGRLGWQ